MCAHRNADMNADPDAPESRIEATLTWLGGGHWRDHGERHERSTLAIAGVVVLLVAAFSCVVATLAVAQSTSWPFAAIIPLTLLFGVLVGAITRATASGPARGWRSVIGRGIVALAAGAVIGELASLVLFSGSIDRHLDAGAARSAESTPVVAQASANLARARDQRTTLDTAVEQARAHRDEALIVARCEYNPSPACPQTHITGVPGPGPETHTANDLLADTQRELDAALADRGRRAPELDALIAGDEQALTQARAAAIAGADRGFGTRWVALNDLSGPGVLMLRLLAIAFCALLTLLPLILKFWRGETTHDRSAAARAERDRAELEADTVIVVKRAEVRAEIENLWAEQQLESARLAVEAQTEIDRAQQQRRIVDAVEAPVAAPRQAHSQRLIDPVEDDMYLPIAAEAEAVSRGAAQLPVGESAAPENLPARVDDGDERGRPLPTIPEVTKAAARWIRPLVPPFVAKAIDTTTHPFRTARQVFEETEEITFTLKRSRKVTVGSEESGDRPLPVETGDRPPPVETRQNERVAAQRVESSADHSWPEMAPQWPSLNRPSPAYPELGESARDELTPPNGPREVRGYDGPRQLPPSE
jgi:hypothetical protein